MATGVTTWGFLLALSLFLGSAHAADSKSSPEKNKQRLEELLVWKVSDALNLDPEKEDQFRTVMKKSRDERASLSREIDLALTGMEKSSSDQERERHLKAYKKLLSDYVSKQVSELDDLEKVLGQAKLAQYLVLKEQLLAKLKDALSDVSSRGKPLKTKVRNPKIIQEE